MTDEILDVDYSLATQATEPWRMELYENYNYYVNGDAQAKSFMRELAGKDYASYKKFIDYIDRFGEEEALKRMSEYLNDHNDRRTASEFYADAD